MLGSCGDTTQNTRRSVSDGVTSSGFATVTATSTTSTSTHEAPSNARMNGVLFLLALSVLINYIDRSNLSIAAELIKHEIHISDFQLATPLSAFFWTYALMQIPAGWLVDRFDVKCLCRRIPPVVSCDGDYQPFARVHRSADHPRHFGLRRVGCVPRRAAKSWVAITKRAAADLPTP